MELPGTYPFFDKQGGMNVVINQVLLDKQQFKSAFITAFNSQKSVELTN